MVNGSDDGQFTLKGWHVLAALLGFFAVIIFANGVFLTVAIRSFPGEHVEKSYVQGLKYNETLERRAVQNELGWKVSIDQAQRAGDLGEITLTFTDATGIPLRGLQLDGRLSRPTSDHADQVLVFDPLGEGRYQANAQGVAKGVWALNVAVYQETAVLRPIGAEALEDGASAPPPQFEFVSRVIFE